MNDMAGWIWPLVAVAVGLALGVMLGVARRGGRSGQAPVDDGGEAGRPGPTAHGEPAGREGSPQQRLLERLRAANLQLSAQIKSLAEAHSRQQQEHDQARHADQQRHEQAVEELRQAHSGELSALMKQLVEQVDQLNRTHADQLKALEGELDRYRQDSRRHSGPGALGGGTRPAPIQPWAAAPAPAPIQPSAAAPVPASTRGGGLPSDYSVTLPMESFKDEPPPRH